MHIETKLKRHVRFKILKVIGRSCFSGGASPGLSGLMHCTSAMPLKPCGNIDSYVSLWVVFSYLSGIFHLKHSFRLNMAEEWCG